MSFRLKGLLADQYQSQVEHSYMKADNVVVLENVPCEMVFESSSGFMEHETAKHNYLPVFHLMGSITEIKGDFPYHVSSLYFTESEKVTMFRDILYYPTPDELAYLIQSGKYYSNHFDIPMVLNHNTYSFPAVVNLMIVPPEDEVAYEQAVFNSSDKTGTLDSDTVDKTNLPIIYVGIMGTGVSRKNDKTLDYYGIELDTNYPSFVLTAESSGYTDPPLMKYIPEPVLESEQQQTLNREDYYLSEEEQRSLLTAQKEGVPEVDLQRDQAAEYYTVSEEDVLVAKADRNISKRVDQRRVEIKTDQEQRIADAKAQQALEFNVESNMKADSESKPKDADVSRESVNRDLSHESVITAGPSEFYEEQRHPDIMQQQADVKMDLNPEQNQTIVDERAENDSDSGSDDVQESDAFDLEHMQGADVSNAEDQAKIEEARVRDMSRDAALMQQTDAVKEDENQAGSDTGSKKLSRSEQAQLEDAVITAEADAGVELDL